jgi:hypothetical protein
MNLLAFSGSHIPQSYLLVVIPHDYMAHALSFLTAYLSLTAQAGA